MPNIAIIRERAEGASPEPLNTTFQNGARRGRRSAWLRRVHGVRALRCAKPRTDEEVQAPIRTLRNMAQTRAAAGL